MIFLYLRDPLGRDCRAFPSFSCSLEHSAASDAGLALDGIPIESLVVEFHLLLLTHFLFSGSSLEESLAIGILIATDSAMAILAHSSPLNATSSNLGE